MRVTTELKNLINRSFDEKRAKIKTDAESKAREEYEYFLNEFGKSKEFKAYAKAAQNLYYTFKDQMSKNDYGSDCKPWYASSYFKNLDGDGVKPNMLCGNNVSIYMRCNDETMKEVRDKVKELDLAQESLMIKLPYEKDLETVRAMLAEYDITI